MNLTACLVHLGYLGTGMLFVRLLGFSGPRFRLRQFLVSYLVGLVAQVTVLYAVAAVRPVPHVLAWLQSVAGIALWANFSLSWARNWWRRRGETSGRVRTILEHWSSPTVWVGLVLVLLLVPPTLSTLMIAKTVPVFGWDGIAIWASKSSALFQGEHLRSEFFIDEDRVHAHRGYPIGLPLFQFHHTAVRGVFDEILLTRALVIVFFLWLLAFFDLIREFAGRTAGIAVCVILMYTPIIYSPVAMAAPLSGFADFPTAALLVMAVGWFNSWLLKGGGINLLGASAALVATAGVKNEGMVWVSVILGLGLLSIVVVRPEGRRRDLLLMVLPIIALVATRLMHAHLPTSSDVHFPSLTEMKQLVSVIPQMAELGVDALSWRRRPLGFLPLIVVIGYGMGILRQWRNRYATLALVGPAIWVIILIVMGLTEVEFGGLSRFTRVTFPRLLFQAAPVSLYWAVILNSPLFPRGEAGIRNA